MRSLGALLLAGGLLAGCAPQATVSTAGLEAVAHPDIGTIGEVARHQLAAQRSDLEDHLAAAVDARAMADAFGGMGELYHTYRLLSAAAACYRNAQRLDPESFTWAYYLGVLHQAAGDFDAATASLERALAKRPDDGPARRRLGEVRLSVGDAATAGSHFRALLDDDQLAAAAHFGLGRAATASGDAATGVEHFTETLRLQPEAGIVHHPLGLALRQLGRTDEARQHLEAKAAGEVVAPDRLMERLESLAISSGAYLKRGNHALVNGRLEEAAGHYRRAVEADSDNAEARRNLALVLVQTGDVGGAVAELKAAIEVDPGNVWLHFDLGNAYRVQGLAEQAVRSLRRAVELDPSLATAHFNLANVLIGLERWEEARPHLKAVLEDDPQDARARYLTATADHRGGDTAAAIAELRSLLDEDPAYTVARKSLAAILVEAKREPQAMAVYRAGLDLDLPAAEKVTLLDPLARLHWKRRQRGKAIECWRQATKLDPTSSQAFTHYANALQLSGKRQQARRYFTRAVELDPTNADAWLSEASLWILSGNPGTARRRLEAGLEAAPNHAGIHHTLARLLATAAAPELRDGRRALALARKAYALERSTEHAETINMAFAELGQFEDAVRGQRALLNQAAASSKPAVLRRLVRNLRRYEARQPIRVAAASQGR